MSITVSQMVFFYSGESQWIYLSRAHNGNAHSIAMNGNVFVASWVIPLVTIILGFCYDSPNSAKFIHSFYPEAWKKSKCPFWNEIFPINVKIQA